jgi:hypothetical protein
MSSYNENDPFNDNNYDYDFKQAQLKSTATLTTVGMVCAIVSVFVGGVLLSLVALVCSAIAFSRMKKIISATSSGPIDTNSTYQIMLKRAKTTLVISIVALVLNIISGIYVFMIFYQLIASGDLSSIANAFYGSDLQTNISSSSSVWA